MRTAKQIWDIILCFFGVHHWEVCQELALTDSNRGMVVAWRQCHRCAKSELIHILQ
jgi:hypothetical protein